MFIFGSKSPLYPQSQESPRLVSPYTYQQVLRAFVGGHKRQVLRTDLFFDSKQEFQDYMKLLMLNADC